MEEKNCCSFCGSVESEFNQLMEGMDNANICTTCAEVVIDELGVTKDVGDLDTSEYLKKPMSIKEHLDKYVVGQEEAKKVLSVAAYNHYKRIYLKSKIEIQKSNVLLIGPSGSGKTLLIQTLAKMLDVPLIIGDATTLTESGYVGDDVQSLVQKLYNRAGKDISKAEKGIIYIDEVDKIAADKDGGRRDVGGRSVQEALLKLVEETEVKVGTPPAGMPVLNNDSEATVSTKNILFIFGGAFVGLENSTKENHLDKKVIGFQTTSNTDVQKKTFTGEYTHEMFIKYGFIPELMGRIPLIAKLEELKKENLVDILTKPKNSIVKQYQELFRMDGVKLKFDKAAIDYIAEEALSRKIGARGLKSIIEKQMLDLMYTMPSKDGLHELLITKEILTQQNA